MSEVDTKWPAWFYGPDGASDVFEDEKSVPKGWKDHPNKVEKVKKATKPDPENQAPEGEPVHDL
jgi:hypothetical protein